MIWTPERKAEVQGLRAEGMTLCEIAIEMGVSRNAISGVVHRLTPKKRHRIRLKRRLSPGVYPRRLAADTPTRAPFEPDISCPDFAWDDDHCAAVLNRGGYPVLQRRAA